MKKEMKSDKMAAEVEDEAEKKKRGGRVAKHVGKVEGDMKKPHLGRPGRRSGGRVGADKSPLSSAASCS